MRVVAGPVARNLFVLVLTLGVATVSLIGANSHRAQRWPEPVRSATAVGDSTCLSCHREKATFEKSAHRLTTRTPTSASIIGSFREGENILRTPNPALYFRMRRDSTGFYESAISGRPPDTTVRTERIAYVAGSGRKGQSFLYVAGDRLFQLPISYWKSMHTWIDSPGPAYVEGTANFERAVAPRCLECHASYVEWVPGMQIQNQYRLETAILGVTCERCHGAGAEHVAGERSVLHAVRSVAIVNASRLSRDRQMEACGQCHGGLGKPNTPSFSYVAGQRLADYLTLPKAQREASVDVHGNQVELLTRSRCYRESQMTCLTCHDVHREQRDITELSGRCLTCHTEKACGLFPSRGRTILGRCVDCHMPLQPSSQIVSKLQGQNEQAMIRTHYIRVYQESRAR